MNKFPVPIIVALAAAFFSVCPTRAADNSIFKMLTCYHGHPRFADGCSLPDKGRQYRSLEDCRRTADALNGNNRMDRHISYKCARKPD
jgi:N-acetyl-beta-hexosaminidase